MPAWTGNHNGCRDRGRTAIVFLFFADFRRIEEYRAASPALSFRQFLLKKKQNSPPALQIPSLGRALFSGKISPKNPPPLPKRLPGRNPFFCRQYFHCHTRLYYKIKLPAGNPCVSQRGHCQRRVILSLLARASLRRDILPHVSHIPRSGDIFLRRTEIFSAVMPPRRDTRPNASYLSPDAETSVAPHGDSFGGYASRRDTRPNASQVFPEAETSFAPHGHSFGGYASRRGGVTEGKILSIL